MLWIAVVVYMVGSAIVAVWMVGAAAFAGAVMHEVHRGVARTPWFVLVRRNGLVGAASWLLRKVMTRRAKVCRAGGVKAFATVMVAPLVGFLAPAALLWLVRISWFPAIVRPSPFLAALSDALVLTGSLGTVISTWVWWRGLCYIARPYIKRGYVRELQVPKELGNRGRDRLAVDFFWSEHLHYTVEKFAVIYPLIIFEIVIPTITPFDSSASSSTTTELDTEVPILVNLLSVVLMFVPSLAAVSVAVTRIQRRFAGSYAAVELCKILRLPEPEKSKSGQIIAESSLKSMEARRKELAHLAELLHQAAGRLDAQQPRGFTPHPTATVFRGVVQQIRQHLRSPNSYDAQIPAELIETLRLNLFLLVDQCDVERYQGLAARVSAFDEAGNPSAEILTKPPSRVARLYEGATATVTRTGAVVAALIGLAVPVIAISLTILGKIDVQSLLRFLK